MIVRNRVTTETIKIEGDSIRELKRLTPLPRADAAIKDVDDQAGVNETDYQLYYRYEYRFEVFNTSGNVAETLAVGTLDEFIKMIPVAFVVGGFDEPSAAELDVLAADAAANWISPFTHWTLHN